MHHYFGKHLDRVAASHDHRHNWRKIGRQFAIIVIATVGLVLLGLLLKGQVPVVEEWIKAQGQLAGCYFVVIFTLCAILLVPANLFVFIAGALFGFGWGYLYAAVSLVITMLLQFWIGRHLLKSRMESFMAHHPKFNAIDRAVSRQGLRVAFLLRLGPVPVGPLSYILSVSRISFRNYALAGLGGLVSPLAMVYYGNLAGHLTKLATGHEHHSAGHYIAMIGGAIVAIIATVYISHVARQALREAGAE
ncbi:MAG: VTT domain-containing protein [Verrucomicrobiota bacterium]